MASRLRNNTSAAARPAVRTSGDSIRWTAGLVLFFTGLVVSASVFFSFFCWEGDQSILRETAEQRELLGLEAENLCGLWGAWLGMQLVDRSFGLFGMLLPVIVAMIGLKVIRQRPLQLNRSALILLLVAILGSLTLGFLFGERVAVIGSSGPGGDFGNAVARMLHANLGVFGTVVLLLGGWILTGVFINRNFINTVNEAGNAVVDRSGRIVDLVKQKVAPHATEETVPDGKGRHEADGEEPETAVPAVPETMAAEGPAPAVSTHSDAVSGPAERVAAGRGTSDEDNPFLDLDPAEPDTPVDLGIERGTMQPAASCPDTAEEEAFMEVDLASAAGRVVMGAGGLVELEHSVRRPAPVSDGPFTEITLEGGEGTPSADFAVQDIPETLDVPEHSERMPLAGEHDGPFTEIALHAEKPAVEPEPAGPEIGEGIVVTVESNEVRLVDESTIAAEAYDPLKDLANYRKPSVALLEDYISGSKVSDEEIFENKLLIQETLANFGIPIRDIHATTGPTVTLYEIVQEQGVRIAKIQGLQNDIAQCLKAESGIRIIAPIPGRGTIGIEVPNRNKQIVSMRSMVLSERFQRSTASLPVVIGATIQNKPFVFDLAKMPHLLVAGATGMGKSVGLNAIIASLLYRMHPAQLKFVMIDPKMVEFSLYARIERHFLAKMESEDEAIITDPKKAVYTLNALCTEMDNRLELCKQAGARNIGEYNAKFVARRLNPNKGHRYLPFIVVVIDEFADLIMTAKEVENPVTRLAQKARAIGIHLIVATQRPSVDVITGKIKANFPARIAFRVMQMIDSRTIIDRPGAEQLIGRGDMLISKDGELTRIQCALVDTPEVERIVEHISKQQGYTEAYALPDYTPEGGDGGGLGSDEGMAPVKYDSLFAEIAREAVSGGQISTSMIQRNYEVGFNRAGRIMMQLERAGIVGRQQGAKPRDILFHDMPSLEAKLQDLGLF